MFKIGETIRIIAGPAVGKVGKIVEIEEGGICDYAILDDGTGCYLDEQHVELLDANEIIERDDNQVFELVNEYDQSELMGYEFIDEARARMFTKIEEARKLLVTLESAVIKAIECSEKDANVVNTSLDDIISELRGTIIFLS